MLLISFDDLIDYAEKEPQVNLKLNEEQLKIISSLPNNNMKIVAGPGSGKTTILVMRILKLIYVDDADPEEILATTFTTKAADELKSRILGWGEAIRQYIVSNTLVHDDIKQQIENLNFNLITTGTIDSISEETLRSHKSVDDVHTIVNDVILQSLMDKEGYMKCLDPLTYPNFKEEISHEIEKIIGKDLSRGGISEFLINLDKRLKENMLSTDRLEDFPCIKECLEKYNKYLEDNLLTDFSNLERLYYEFITRSGNYLKKYKFVFIDEYQDTNCLQESIFHELMRSAIKNGGSCLVVGDDDQSMYRFRGSHVYLFSNLENRINLSNARFEVIYLYKNYRSTSSIVDFYNKFIKMDDKYQEVRIKNKPEIIAEKKDCINYPILGMFRDNKERLSEDLSKFIAGLIKNKSYKFTDKKNREWVINIGEKGSISDFIILCNSPEEFGSPIKFGDEDKKRMPYHVRECMQNHGMEVSNLRGQSLQNIDGVELICGLTLCCIDPDSYYYDRYVAKYYVSKYVSGVFNRWRKKAEKFLEKNSKTSLKICVEDWKRLLSGKQKKHVTVTNIIYSLLPWVTFLYNNSNGVAYLQAILKTVENSSYLNSFGGKIAFSKNGGATEGSIRSVLRDIFVPIASGKIKIDEKLTNGISDDKLNIMSIHQAKGLEFPITIVDISSEFSRNHPKQRFKRFPSDKDVDITSKIENFISSLSGKIDFERKDVDRCFDDLYRKFYVSFSRPQDILLLVGLKPTKKIPNVAVGWTRNEEWKFEGLFENEIVHI